MKLIQSYSRTCSVDIKDKPNLFLKYFPLIEDRYITIQTKSGMNAKDYSFFAEVVDILKPYLDKENIKIVQLGQDCPSLADTLSLIGATTVNQAGYVLKHSACHISVDSWSCHFCGAENVPLVSLYGSTTVDNHSPYHYNPDISIFLESDRNGNKASFQREESPKMVDLIKPEDVARSVCKLLHIHFDYPYKTVYIHPIFSCKTVESALDNVINVSVLGIPSLIVRLDYNYNLETLVNQLNTSKCTIVTNREIPIEILKRFKGNIQEIVYKIEERNSPEFAKQLMDLKVPFKMFSDLEEEQVNKIKTNYFDIPMLIIKREVKIPEPLKNVNIDNLWYKGSKILLGRGKIYQSYWAYKNDLPIDNLKIRPQKVINKNLNDLWAEQENILFLEKVA